MRERKRKRLLRKWRSGWALRTFSGLKKEKLQTCLRLCLAAALMWEGAWFACQAVSVEDVYKRQRFFWTGISVKRPFTGKLPWAEKSRICFWRSTVLMANPITYPAFPGAEMPGTLPALRWVPESGFGEGFRAGSIPKS